MAMEQEKQGNKTERAIETKQAKSHVTVTARKIFIKREGTTTPKPISASPRPSQAAEKRNIQLTLPNFRVVTMSAMLYIFCVNDRSPLYPYVLQSRCTAVRRDKFVRGCAGIDVPKVRLA